MEFFATCPKGFESLLAGELASLGIEPRALKGQVAFEGDLSLAYRACLRSRIASRVMLVLGRIDAADSDTLYEGISSVDWNELIPVSSTIAIDAHGMNDQLRNTRFLAQRAKDAIADQLLEKRGARPMVDATHPDARIAVRLRGTRATVAADLSGDPLFRRGYERINPKDAPFAPLRADYAAALLAAGAWHRACRHDSPSLASVFPGAGSVLVEAAAEAAGRAPGLLRARWGFEGWAFHDAGTWEELVETADAAARDGASRGSAMSIVACDPRRGAEGASRAALRAAGVPIEPRCCAPGSAELEHALALLPAHALTVIDLSWADIDAAASEAQALSLVRQVAAALPEGSAVATLSKDASIGAALATEPASSIATIVGSDDATLSAFEMGPADERQGATVTLPDGRSLGVLVGASDQFAARLAKVAKARAKWARKEDVTCYRVYDADLPDYAVSLDLYQGSGKTPGRWLVAAEYAAPKGIDPEVARRRLLDALAISPAVMGVDPADVILRVRRRAKGGSQYSDGGAATDVGETRETGRDPRGGRVSAGARDTRGRRHDDHHGHKTIELPQGSRLVDEGGLTFEVNLSDHLDTGLFLDHREVRSMVREMAKQTAGSKRFCNLFAYTGTATCYAADGGAKHTTTVDLSATYLEIARRNMARNGFVGPEHEFVQADVIAWISEQRHTKNRWDLVFCDPPTFSNSSRMRSASFDVQRDHAELLIGVSRLLTRAGVCVFSCNLRGFEPDVEKLERAGVSIEDVTAGTIPEDFSRNAKIHHCYLVRRTPRA